PFHITNMCAKDMGILVGHPEDFQDWATINHDRLKKRYQWIDDISFSYEGCNHYPRAIMGEYLKERFQEAHQKAQALGLGVELFSGSEVIDLEERSDDKIHLTVKQLSSGSIFSCIADRILLATGHWFEKKEEHNYFPSPWPARQLLEKIPEGEKVAVIGTSLSAIEVVLTLTSNGHFIRDNSNELVYVPPTNPRKFALYSRRGLLPKVRGKMGKYRNMFLTRKKLESLIAENQGYLNLEAVFQLLNSELEAAYGHDIDWNAVVDPTRPPAELLQQYLEDARHGDGPDGELVWQTVLHQSFDMVRKIYLRLSLEDRKRFDKTYTSVFFIHAATQPAINAEKMLALMKSGLVEVFKLGRNYQFVKNDTKDVWEFIYQDSNGETKRDVYRYVVNARGQAKSIQTDPSPLTKNLLKRGIVQNEEAQPVQQENRQSNRSVKQPKTKLNTYKTGSMWIDPVTHQVIRKVSDKTPVKSNSIYAIGAMTRSQIIDASMAHGIVQSTARIANSWVDDLKKIKM
ncbi:MAG: FAD/NAD(P)-binding protein, partial [Desulfobacterales bacterium]